METKNKYNYPLKKGEFKIMEKYRSPAHSGVLKNAIDFECKQGTSVLAALDGEVAWIKKNSKVGGTDRKKYWYKGNRIVIKHKNNEFTAYEHLIYNGVTVKVGEKVKAGQVIGYSGVTGYTFNPHLHFEVFLASGPDDEKNFQTVKIRFKKLV